MSLEAATVWVELAMLMRRHSAQAQRISGR